jgi:hypothetical protein
MAWLIICFVCTLLASSVIAVLIITFAVNQKDPEFTTDCEPLNIQTNRKLGDSLENSSSLKIINVTEDSLTFLANCDSALQDELGNIYKISGPYKLVCEEQREFNYTDKVTVWSTKKIFSSVPSGYELKETEEEIIRGINFKQSQYWCFSRYAINQHKEQLQLCYWKEEALEVLVNNDSVPILDSYSVANPLRQMPFGVWRNSTSAIVNTEINNYLKGTKYNYSAVPLNPNPDCGRNFVMPAFTTIDTLPSTLDCSVEITISFKIGIENIYYCPAVLLTKHNGSEGIGVRPSISEGNCTISVLDNLNYTYFITLEANGYRFFKDIISINCKDQSDGLYTECGQSEFVPIVVRETSILENNTIEVIEIASATDAEEILTNSFDTKLSSNVKTMIIWIIIISVIIVPLIIGIILL